jgi:outer membrane protein assembly factor BamB
MNTNPTQPNGNVQAADSPPNGAYQLAVRVAAVAGVFSIVVCALLVSDYVRRGAKDPSEDRAYQALKAAVASEPDNEALRTQLREFDLHLREKYFRQRRFATVGTWLLLGGVIVFLIAAKSAATLRRKLPEPAPQAVPVDRETPNMQIARWAVGALALILVGAIGALSISFRSDLPEETIQVASVLGPDATGGVSPDDAAPAPSPAPAAAPSAQVAGDEAQAKPAPKPAEGETAEAADLGPPDPPEKPFYPTADEIRTGWLRFRGPNGSGISPFENVPESWDGAAGKNVVWKAPVPLAGNSSAVVVGDFVFLTGADETRREVFCFQSETGKLRWRRAVPGTPESTAEPPKVDDATGFAAPTASTDGRWVFTMFANGDVAAHDFGGNLVWARSLGMPENIYGHASTPVLYGGLLLVQFDQGGTAKDEKSKLIALDAKTGETVYEVPRPVPNSWTSPIVVEHGGREQLITAADPWVISYNPADGTELWRADCLAADCGPSPVFHDGVVHVGNEYCVWTAIRADGEGDVTESDKILWIAEDGLPDTCSPLVTDEYLFLLATWGALTAFDAESGEMLWEQDFDATFTSSPSWAAGRVYLFSDEGKGWIIGPSREEDRVEVVAENDLGERCVTCPAFQDGRLYIRGEEHLFCIGK